MAAGLEDAIADMLIKNTLLAARRHGARSLMAANLRLRTRLIDECPLKVHVPAFAYCQRWWPYPEMSGWASGAFPDIDPGLKPGRFPPPAREMSAARKPSRGNIKWLL